MLPAMRMTGTALLGLVLAFALISRAAERDYRFDGRISREVLDNYLSRAATFADFLHGKGSVADNLRFLTNTGAKFVGRAIYRWGGEDALPALLETAKPIARQARAADPEMILQAACFEIVTTSVGKLPVPEWLFLEFGLLVEQRTFRYEAMLYPDGKRKDQWAKGASVPDMSQLETRMWFLFLAASYIDVGVEAIHFGQVEIMDERDKDHVHWGDLLARARAYAAQHARRHFILCDAHVPSGGIAHNDRLLLDFHSFPLRIAELPDKPQEGVLKVGYMDTIYGRSKGGLTPSGWSCQHLPYLVELDNYGVSRRPGQPGAPWFTWGYDEISWFAHQPESYRNEWLRYAWKWLREHDSNGWLEMPGSRTLHAPVGNQSWYWANTRSAATPEGFNQEETIKAIWAEDAGQRENGSRGATGSAADEAALFARSQVSPGDTARLQRAFAKACRGDSVTVGVIGGSITQGAGASQPDRRYGDRVAAWWRQTFPKATVRSVNAGIGATGSDYGALRARRDLLSHHPDFVVVEYAVNDPNTQAAAESFEGLTRQILREPNQPAVVLLFTMNQEGGNAQEWQAQTGRHYNLPMVSFRDALWPEIKAGRMKWSDVEADVVHPNDRGHEYCARFITRLLEQVRAALPADDGLPQIKPVPEPLISDQFEHVALFEAGALKPLSNQGWTLDAARPGGEYWAAEQPGSLIDFEVPGKVVLLMDWHIRGPMGQAKVRVDDQPPQVREAWFDQTWGGYRQTTVLARDLGPGRHKVSIELLPEKNPQSTGHEFRVLGLGAAGIERDH